MFKKEEKRKVGRPKLANKKLKKTSIVMCIISIVAIIALLIVGTYKLDIIKLRGDVSNKYELGDEFCLKTECFITIRDKGSSVIAIAKYNLLVGNTYDTSESALVEILPDTKGYGLQSSQAKGYIEGESEYVGVVGFIKDDQEVYWNADATKDNYDDEITYTAGIVTTYVKEVYDNNSNIYQYVSAYKNKLNKMGYDLNVRLTTYGDLFYINQGVELSNDTFAEYQANGGKQKANLDKNLSFLSNSSYWLGYVVNGTISGENIYYRPSTFTYSEEAGDPDLVYGDFYNNNHYGVRPVIEIDKNQIPANRGFSEDDYVKGQVINLGGESFNVISQDDDSVRMLAKYNLMVGTIFDDVENTFTDITEDDEGYGRQSSIARGFLDDKYKLNVGIVKFAKKAEDADYFYWQNTDGTFNDDYSKTVSLDGEDLVYGYVYDSNSELYKYLYNYENYLKSQTNMSSIKVSILDYKDLVDIFINKDTGNSEVPSWYNTANYWTGIVSDKQEATKIFAIVDNNYLVESYDVDDDDMYSYAGIRPVIQVSKSELKEKETPTTTTKQDIKKGTTKKITTVKSSKTSLSSLINANKTTTKATTKSTTKKVKDLVKKVNITNTNEDRSFLLLLIINGILLIIIIIELILLIKKKRKTNN